MKKYPLGLLAVPLAASMVLAGCGGDAKPEASSSSTRTSSPTTTSTPTTTTASPTTTAPKIDPNIPAAARAHTTAGAEAFVRYFLERSNVAWTVPRAGILSPLCQATSVACAEYEKEAARLSKAGHRYDGDPLTVEFIDALDKTGANQLGFLASVVQERRSEIDSAGKIWVTDQRMNLRLHFQLLYTGHAWSVLSIKIMK